MLDSENCLDALADASSSIVPVIDSGSEVLAVVILAESLLAPGSNIDVYRAGLFWEAVIVAVKHDSFRFRFLHAGPFTGGWVRRKDFLIRWRFPVRVGNDVWKAELIATYVLNQD